MPTVYKLINPIDHSIYYIGYTEFSIEERLKMHIQTKQVETTKFILNAGLLPIIEKIEEGDNISKAIEMQYIKQYLTDGHKLDNRDGVINYQKSDLEGISPKMAYDLSLLPKEDQYKAALNLILSELPLNATYPICVRIKDIIDTILLN